MQPEHRGAAHTGLSSREIIDLARELGFTLAGIVPARPSPHLEAYFAWLRAGMHGTMSYMARADRVARRRDLNLILPGARSLVAVGMGYPAADIPRQTADDPARGRISSYAWGADYHDVMLRRLEALAAFIRSVTGGSAATRCYVDTGALLERSHAQQAGLGFIGKNTLLIHPRRGSFFFLGEVITTAELDCKPGLAALPSCGTCSRCLSACPTSAFPRPYVLDARRCISYLTIEHRGFIPRDLRPQMGRWVYGCDICQQACPWQRFAPSDALAEFAAPDIDRAAPLLVSLLALDEAAFARLYRGTAIFRLRRDRLVRNACVAAGNSDLPELSAHLLRLLADTSPLVRGHAAWALGMLGREHDALRTALTRETDQAVRDEIRAALG